jgi:hypothetical protein
VRRLLQFGVLLLSLAAFLTPIIEFFDQWDPPGPGGDTELAVFGLILTFCLILLVSKLVASLDKLIERIILFRIPTPRMVLSPERFLFHRPRYASRLSPLRI